MNAPPNGLRRRDMGMPFDSARGIKSLFSFEFFGLALESVRGHPGKTDEVLRGPDRQVERRAMLL